MDNLNNTKKINKWILTAVVFSITVLAVGAFFYLAVFKGNLTNLNPATSAEDKITAEKTRQIREEVGKLILLPTEEPVIAIVKDKKQLINQPFLTEAEIGDILLMYLKAKKAILYRPNVGKIVSVAPISVTE